MRLPSTPGRGLEKRHPDYVVEDVPLHHRPAPHRAHGLIVRAVGGGSTTLALVRVVVTERDRVGRQRDRAVFGEHERVRVVWVLETPREAFLFGVVVPVGDDDR
jgi:hypothetical protein